jgi:hypothetical protein
MADPSPRELLQAFVPQASGGDAAAATARRDRIRALAEGLVDDGAGASGRSGAGVAATAIGATQALGDGLVDA